MVHDGDRIRVRSAQPDTHLLILAGKWLAMNGTWVMTTRHELARAEADFRADVF